MIAAAASVLAVTSCGGNSKKEVSIRDVDIYGEIYYENKDTGKNDEYDADEFISIPSGTYEFYIKDDMLYVTIDAKIIKDFPDPYASSVSAEDFELQIYDGEGNPIKNSEGDNVYMEFVNIDDLENMLNWSDVGDYYEWTFSYALLGETGILDKISSFDIDFELYVYYIEESEDTSSSTSSSLEDDLEDIYDEIEEDLDGDLQDAQEALETSKEILDLFF